MNEVERLWKKYCMAKENAEQDKLPFLVLFDATICSEYEDLVNDFSEEHKELFVKNVNFMLSKIS